jgi:hypothetical protein
MTNLFYGEQFKTALHTNELVMINLIEEKLITNDITIIYTSMYQNFELITMNFVFSMP